MLWPEIPINVTEVEDKLLVLNIEKKSHYQV